MVLPNGKITNRSAISVPESLYQRVFERVTRGLFFWHTGIILSKDISVKVELLVGRPNLDASALKALEEHTVAEGAFEYRFGLDPEDNRNAIWLFGLHQAHWLYAKTGVLADE
jgi:hypothetical protein